MSAALPYPPLKGVFLASTYSSSEGSRDRQRCVHFFEVLASSRRRWLLRSRGDVLGRAVGKSAERGDKPARCMVVLLSRLQSACRGAGLATSAGVFRGAAASAGT